ncbi:hypothetical protein TEA_024564 [Camellia sinensis var. sinensis]|uniref:AMP-dependent synthetase/ligase domain-containing protein n=1 Tax=Camellia sinensis var. sinensis TaxID=542762 RepID=A0A4S4EN42_CAMSN|nr:hypothetical protein TEA_024564 [Camellia sinensis var. sinensis]
MYTRLIQGYEAMDPELREASASAASKLRPMMCGSSALPYPVMQQWETITKHHLLERYGMTEFVMAISIPLRGIKKGSTVGKPVPGVQHGGNCMEKGATIPPNKETKLPCCSSLYRGPHISEEMGFLKVGAHKRYLRQCSVASEEQKKVVFLLRNWWKKIIKNKRMGVIEELVEKIHQIEELPLKEFHGHTSDVLDLAWSKSNCLLSSWKDKTVRLQQVGCNECISVFQHNDYANENYFMSGSINGKARIWGVTERQVVDWADVRDVTARCYHPDAKLMKFTLTMVSSVSFFFINAGLYSGLCHWHLPVLCSIRWKSPTNYNDKFPG